LITEVIIVLFHDCFIGNSLKVLLFSGWYCETIRLSDLIIGKPGLKFYGIKFIKKNEQRPIDRTEFV